VTKAKTELETAIAMYSSHDEAIVEVATRLLRAAGLLRVEEVRDIDSCAEHLGTWIIDGLPPVLTDEVITTALDAVPGGSRMLLQSTPEEIRSALARMGFGPEQTGHELLQQFLEKNECAPGALDAANRILCEPRRYLGVLLNAIVYALSQEERLALETLYNHIGVANPAAVLIAPSMNKVRSFLVGYLQNTPPGISAGVSADMLTVFNPSGHYVRPDQSYGDHRSLMSIVYDELIEITLLASDSFDSEKNLRRVTSALDNLELDVRTLRGYDKLYRLCRDGTRSQLRSKEPPKAPVAIFASIAAVYAAIEACARENGIHRGKRLILPTREEFVKTSAAGIGLAAAVEMQTNQSYQAVIAVLAERKGYALPGRSEPHRVMNRLVLDALREIMIDEPKEEYTNPELFARQRIDLFVRVEYPRPGELLPYSADLCFEADGAQHFTNVDYWGGSSRSRDRVKARSVLRAAKTRPMSLISLHHGVLTGAKSKLMTSTDLSALVKEVAVSRYPWVFVRPTGSRDMRAIPRNSTPVQLRDVVTSPRLEVFVLPSVEEKPVPS
jgi:hypothetical protein